MNACPLLALAFLAALGVVVWLIGERKRLQRELEEQRRVARLLYEQRIGDES